MITPFASHILQSRAYDMIATVTQSTFAGTRLVEPIDRRQHVQFMERRIAGKRLVDAPKRPSHVVGHVACQAFVEAFPCPPSSIPTYREQWFDDPNFNDPAYHVPEKHLVPPHKPVAIDCLLCDESFRTLAERKQHSLEVHHCVPQPKPLVWDHEIKIERCYTGLAQNEILLSTLLEPVGDVVSFGYRFDSDQTPLSTPHPQPPPSPLPNASSYEEFHIPALPRKSAAKTEKGVARFLENRELALLQRRILYQVGEMMLFDAVKVEKDEARRLGVPYTGFENDHTDRRNYCKQCGASFFHRVQGKLRCYDCGWALKNSEKDGDSEGLKKFMQGQGLGNDGSGFHLEGEWNTGTTQGAVPDREKWLKPRRYLFNPKGKKYSEMTAEDFEEIKSDPQFQTALAEYQTTFSGSKVTELAEQLGVKSNTLTKRISRQELNPMFHDVDFPTGHFFCVVTLNGVNFLKILGGADASLPDVLAAFLKEWKASEVNAIKMARKTAKKSGADQQTREKKERDAVEGVRDAYQTVVGVFLPDAEGFGCTYFSFYGHQELITAILEGCKR